MALIKSQWLNGVSVNGTTTDPEEVTGATRFGVSMETTGGPSTAHVTLQGSIDGSHWFSLVGLNTAATVGGYNSDIDPVAVPIAWIRLLMDALTGGSSPTVSASAIAV